MNETKCHLSAVQKCLLEQSLSEYSLHVPSEFNRSLNSGFNCFQFWKATEFRQFMLYAGVSVLRDILPENLYHNFLYFVVSMRLLLSDDQQMNMSRVKYMLEKFVKGAKRLYGDGFISYNMHTLIHLPEDYITYGNLESVSCFPFENYLGAVIKGRLTGKNKPLQQICRHVSAENKKLQPKILVQKQVNKYFIAKTYKFTCGLTPSRDNCVMTSSNKIGFITSFAKTRISLTSFSKHSLFLAPVNSMDVGIYLLKNCDERSEISKQEIVSKIIIVLHNQHFVGLKML